MSDWPDPAPARPLWLVTLADLALLLVGFFVLLHATRVDPAALAHSFRAGFDAEDAPMPVAAQGLANFASASAVPPDMAALTVWARQALADPRVTLTVAGEAEGGADVDAATGSAQLLAADRARAVAAILAPLAPARVTVAVGSARRRAVTVTLAFAGEQPRTKP